MFSDSHAFSSSSGVSEVGSYRRRGRGVEGIALLREHTPKGYRKFESSRLRQNEKGIPRGIPFFIPSPQTALPGRC
jgi:hypothetical protein